MFSTDHCEITSIDKEEENDNDLNEIIKLASQNSLSSFLSSNELAEFDPVFAALRDQLNLDISLQNLRKYTLEQLN